MRPVCPAATRAAADDLELLAEQLGDDHDLFLLQDFITKHCAVHSEEIKTLGRLIAAQQNKFRSAALKLGGRLYAETSVEFCQRVASWRR
jgi:hypothetical protein